MRGALTGQLSDQGDGAKPPAFSKAVTRGRSGGVSGCDRSYAEGARGGGRRPEVVSPGRAARRLRRALILKRSIRQGAMAGEPHDWPGRVGPQCGREELSVTSGLITKDGHQRTGGCERNRAVIDKGA